MFRRTGHTDDRRRRVLTEEVVQGAGGQGAGVRSPATTRLVGDSNASLYADAAKVENHCRISDLIPRRLSMVAVISALSAAAIGALVALHHVVGATPRTAATAVDLAQFGSLGGWLGAAWLQAAAAVSLLLYSLRRHRQSDYHGRYRVWLWAALAALGMSVGTAAPVHLVLAGQLATRTGWQLPGGTLLFWLLPLGGVLAVVGVRLILEIRASRLAFSAFLMAVMCQATALALFHSGSKIVPPGVSALVAGGSQLTGHFLVLLTMLLFARHVLLEIEGRLPRREAVEPKAKPAAATMAKLGDTPTRKIDPPHETPPAPVSRLETPAAVRRLREEADEEQQWYDSKRHDRKKNKPSRETSDERDEFEEEEDGDHDGRKLSKAERKRLRRLKAQQRHSEFS